MVPVLFEQFSFQTETNEKSWKSIIKSKYWWIAVQVQLGENSLSFGTIIKITVKKPLVEL